MIITSNAIFEETLFCSNNDHHHHRCRTTSRKKTLSKNQFQKLSSIDCADDEQMMHHRFKSLAVRIVCIVFFSNFYTKGTSGNPASRVFSSNNSQITERRRSVLPHLLQPFLKTETLRLLGTKWFCITSENIFQTNPITF